jgi:hypothetical protein
MEKETPAFVSLIETLMLDATDGTEVLKDINFDFQEREPNEPYIATKEQAVDHYEILKEGTFAQIFGSFGVDLDRLCLTQSQINNFCEKHSYCLSLHVNRPGTYFLFRFKDTFFVAFIKTRSYELEIYVDPFDSPLVWNSKYFRLVVPHLSV